MRKSFLVTLGGALGLMFVGLCSGPAWAEPTQTNLSGIVVTATRTERELVQVPSSVSVVDSDMMKAQPQASLAELLQDIPNVEVQDQGVPGMKKITLRGDSAARALILIDGQKIGSQKSMDGIPFMIDPNEVERIEVIKGPASVLYGSEAVGGVVNIITKKGGERPVQADVFGTYHSAFGGITSGGSVYGSVNNIEYRFSGAYTDAGDLDTPSGHIDDTSFLNRDLSAYLGYTWDDGSLGLKGESFWSNSNSPVLPVEATMPRMPTVPAQMQLDLPEWKRDKVGLFFEHRNITPWFAKVAANAFYQKTNKEFDNGLLILINNPFAPFNKIEMDLSTTNKETSLGGELQLDWTPTDSLYLVTGIAYTRDDMEADEISSRKLYRRVPPPPFIPSSSKNHYEGNQDNLSLFAQAEWSVTNDVILTAGIRETFIKTELEETTDPVTKPTGSESSSHPVGSVGLVYSGLTDWTFRALFAQGYRAPNVQQLFLGTNHGGVQTFANPDLEEETSNDLELGVRYNNGQAALDVTLFGSKARDYITPNGKDAAGRKLFDNADKATTYGAELEISYLFEELGLTPYVSGAYTRRKFDFKNPMGVDDTTWKTGTPILTGRAGLRYERAIMTDLTFTSDLYGRFASKTEDDFSEVLGNEKKAGWGTCNLALGLLYGEEQDYRLSVNLNNIFDKEYIESASELESPGFHAIVRLDVSF